MTITIRHTRSDHRHLWNVALVALLAVAAAVTFYVVVQLADSGNSQQPGDELIVAGGPGAMQRLDPRSGEPVGEPRIGGGGAGDYALDATNGRLATLGDLVQVWDLESGGWVQGGVSDPSTEQCRFEADELAEPILKILTAEGANSS